jgi:hypothetical protein
MSTMLTKAQWYTMARENCEAAAAGLLVMDTLKAISGSAPSVQRLILASIKGANTDWRDDNDVDAMSYRPSDTSLEVVKVPPPVPAIEPGVHSLVTQ